MSISLLQQLRLRGYDALGPGVDPTIIWLLKRYHFPAARLWASANASGGDIDVFRNQLPARQAERAGSVVARKAFEAVGGARATAMEATEAWREMALLGTSGDLAKAESTRRRAASKHLAAMAPLSAAVGRKGLPLVDWAMCPRAEAPSPPGPEAFAAPADIGGVEAGAVYRESGLMRQWISAPAETGVAADRAIARVTWPAEGDVLGAVVAGSGVGVEWDLYVRARSGYDFAAAFTAHGIAVVEMASPAHGLRAPPGRYGGEAFFAGAPVSAAALLQAQCRETARYLAWARGRFDRPVGVFGLSMSSFAAQLALSHSHAWPEAARPAAGFLLAHAGDLKGVVQGKLSRILGVEAALEAAGWTEADLEPWREALAPTPEASVPGERIVSVTGYLDRVTPFRDGARLARDWGLPRENRFRMPHGHMALPKRLFIDDRPIARFAAVLASAA